MYHPHHLSIISIPTFAKSSLSLSSSPSSSSPPLTSSSSVNPLEINPKPPSNSNTSHVDMGNLIPSSDTPSPQSEHLIMKTSSSSATPFNNDSNCDSNHSSNQTYTTTKCSKPSNLRYQSIQQVSSAQSNSSQSLNPYSGNSTQTDVKSRKFGLTLNISPYPQSDTNLNSKWNSSLPSNNPISPQLPSRKTHSSSPPISPTILEHSRVFASPASISYPSPTHLFPSNLTSLSFVYDASAVSKDKDNSNPSSPFQPLSSSSMPLPPLTPPPRVASQRQFPRSSSPSSPSLSPQPRLPSLQVQPSPSIHSRILLSPSRHHNRLPQSPSSLCSPYASELTQSPAFQPRSGGWSSRQSSLPSLMSMPPTRAASPDQTASSSSSSQHQHLNGSLSSRLLPHSSALNSVFRAQNQASGSSSPSFYQKSSSSSPLAAVNAAFAIGSTGSTNVSQGRSSSRVLKHYERVRSPSLRGHSRTTSFSELAIPSKLNSPSILNFSPRDRNSASVEFEMPIELGEETLRPEEESRSFDFQCDWSGEDNFEYNGLNEARKVFKPGERIGVGIFHQGHRVRNVFEASEGVSRRLSLCSSGPAGSGLLEIVGQIGVGTYAVVYLVREVLYDPDLELDSTHPDTSLSQTPRASDGFAALSPESGQPSTISLRRRRKSSSIIYGRDFALKCLCKQNLSRELLMIQRGEAELHQSLPLHENIVSLYWALETPNWLFMVIEYCPGQDLFYWLEQSKDSQDLESLASRANSYSAKFPSFTSDHTTTFRSSMSAPFELLPKPSEPTSMDHNTPPSPSLLATTADDEMLSRRRLRLISRMFVQMCDAVQACHLAGVCHRDIKPENFIVVDYRQSNSSSSHEREKSVIVKITDWGLGTSSKICEDFDCGSKPYMSYECRNNLHPCYAPAPADVWSLGIVLLNLLYHRCPWSDPSLTDADFNQFKRDPINFFCGRFEGMTGSVAEFLANRVFCEVGYNEAGHRKERITAGEFGEWAKDLLSHMGGGQLHASVSDSTIVMSPSVGRSGLFYGDTLPPSEASKRRLRRRCDAF
ncbi:expressed protein [Phakopsora pachyrhizi]|uniref:non-specific serine/threonine protein kinase n=1 Tax=Phakopsora pachyrhizi TaxID=170000 RepID=A0AAV0B818_PHAPC|nr:expressed protein [Phakopsora pachyrhizi]